MRFDVQLLSWFFVRSFASYWNGNGNPGVHDTVKVLTSFEFAVRLF